MRVAVCHPGVWQDGDRGDHPGVCHADGDCYGDHGGDHPGVHPEREEEEERRWRRGGAGDAAEDEEEEARASGR